jgi:hypothetical protein
MPLFPLGTLVPNTCQKAFWKHFGNIGGGLRGNVLDRKRLPEKQEVALPQEFNGLSESFGEFAVMALGIAGRLGVGGSNPLAPTKNTVESLCFFPVSVSV